VSLALLASTTGVKIFAPPVVAGERENNLATRAFHLDKALWDTKYTVEAHRDERA